MDNPRIQTLAGMVHAAQKLCTWHLNSELQLVESNCENEAFFYNLFSVSCCGEVKDHFAKSKNPLIVSDPMGIAWITGPEIQNDSFQGIYLLGPFFTMEASESCIRAMCYRQKLSSTIINQMIAMINQLPVIHLRTSIRYAIMLYYGIYEKEITANEVTVNIMTEAEAKKPEWGSPNWHGTWAAEQELFAHIRDGNMNNFAEIASRLSAGKIGKMSLDDPLRQVKNEGIVFAVLCSRAAILGGVSPEGGYNLADYYILRIEAAKSISAAQYCTQEMLEAFLRRIQQAKQSQQYSTAVSACAEYVRTHISEKVSLDAMAKELGYNSYYLSSKFQKEVGVSINNYISAQKIEQAKFILDTQVSVTVTDLSERLSFSSPSYFTSTFRKHTGMTPLAWQQRKNKQ